MTSDPNDDEFALCPHCAGSGEGSYDGSRCLSCRGSGTVGPAEDDGPDLDERDDDPGYDS